jgi:hypothetical protein
VKEKKVKPTPTPSDKALRKNLLRRKTRGDKTDKNINTSPNKPSKTKSP